MSGQWAYVLKKDKNAGPVENDFCNGKSSTRFMDIEYDQPISQSFIVALMTEALELKGPERILGIMYFNLKRRALSTNPAKIVLVRKNQCML